MTVKMEDDVKYRQFITSWRQGRSPYCPSVSLRTREDIGARNQVIALWGKWPLAESVSFAPAASLMSTDSVFRHSLCTHMNIHSKTRETLLEKIYRRVLIDCTHLRNVNISMQIMTFIQWTHRSPVNFPHKSLWRGASMLYLICAWINGWVNNGEAGDLRRHRTHYDVIVIIINIM